MSQSLGSPSATELLDAVDAFLKKDIAPQLDAHTSFHLKVACNMLQIVSRAITQGSEQEAEGINVISALLDQSPDKQLDALYETLCHEIKEGNLDLKTPDLLETLKSLTLQQVAIDNPKYSGYQQALNRSKA